MVCFYGCIVEYYSSYIGEMILHVKWWDYSNDFLNINGRTCLYYAVCWGFLTIVLINYINPMIDKILGKVWEKISHFFIKSLVTFITLFMAFDGALTCYALDNFLIRVASEYNININGIEETSFDNKGLAKQFSNEKMMMTYPNIIVVNDKDEIVHLGTVLSNVKNYYYKFENK